LGRDECDLARTAAISRAITEASPDLVINAAAYTAVDRAESEPDIAMAVNADAPAALADVCAERNAAFIHLSTDYVFDGMKRGAYIEGDPVSPLSVYGRTKEAGETAVRGRLNRHVVIRTSWVFSSHGTNFVKTMLRLGRTNNALRVVADQAGAPTSARDIARAVLRVAEMVRQEKGVWGTFHFSSAEPTTWHGFAQAIFGLANGTRDIIVTPISTAEYPTAARRPLNSVLDCSRICGAYNIGQPSWRAALADALLELPN
jgi:dTDP-4-dehydrorhamnose reductase